MSQHKAEVALLLEYVFSLYSLKRAKMPPSAHEFVIHCEQYGVKKSDWATDMGTVEGVEPSLLTPKQLLQKLIALDRVGRVQRLIELCHTVQDLHTCVRKIGKLFALPEDAEEGADAESDLSYAAKCQLISKLISKARRTVTVPNPHKGKKQPRAKKEGSPAKDPATEAEPPAEERDVTVVEDPTTAAAEANEEEEELKGAKIVDLTEEEKETFKEMVRRTFQLLETVLASRPAHITQQPLTKFMHFSKWCLSHHLIEEDAAEDLSKFEDEAQTAMGQQAEQLEVVMKLKALPTGDEAALRELLDALWTDGKEKSFAPHSADVLSCIATAATASGISEALRELVAERLTKTHTVLKKDGTELPRRALRLVNDILSKKKHDAIKQQLEEEKKQHH
ncbi:hypothetical protein STCU_05589 [Strigomonas culicis]|uniref:Uncharacterized protein n=1 Tax=Strigomonas culicis TaxID=28005 RepID=S9UG79_9TRYP|nr:hypothetical protein STCU_05589 [Strigomonas culicis]|eukprot:EPY27749.1 hypothetical protein STCU_05589 [Strigomonas culicis]